MSESQRREGIPPAGAIAPHRFEYLRAGNSQEAAAALAREGAAAMGGGTDLLVQIDEGLAAPSVVVDLRSAPELSAIVERADGSIRIGAAVTVDEIERHPRVAAAFPALAESCSVVGTPALRMMGTIGGNLCQRPRCWYFRRAIPCLRNGGSDCPARDGENQYLAILEGGPCYIVHPSDPAVALVALQAEVDIGSAQGTRRVALSEFFVLPRDDVTRENVLGPGEFIQYVTIPASSAGGTQLYQKTMQRGAWDFALVSVAGVRTPAGDVRLVLGGVAPRPWRAPLSVEEDVASGGIDEDSASALAERALYDAEPLSRNGYKVALATAVLRDAIMALAR
jgi:xanthine dehydrogenase YagS FAD-binding subunit